MDIIRKAAVVAAFFFFLPLLVYSQSRSVTLSGFVLDSESGESLIGAGVMAESTGVVTNSFGFFSIPLKPGRHVISCSYLGYENYEMETQLMSDTTIVVKMNPNVILDEAVVTAARKERIGITQVSVTDIKNSPVVFCEPDILKTIQMLPGVQSGLEGTAGIFIRGGGADENLFLLDGVPMYNVSHLLGVFSAFTPEAVKNVSLYKGAFPARYGGRVSSILDIRTNEGNLHSFHGSVASGLLNTKLHLEGPVINGKTSFSVSARGLNTIFAAPFLSMANSKYNYYFYDINGKLVHIFSPSNVLMFSVYHGRDVFSYLSDEELVQSGNSRYISQDGTDMNWGNFLASLKWNRVWDNRLFSNSSVSWYSFDTVSDIKEWKTQNKLTTLDETILGSSIRDLIFRSDLDFALTRSHKIMAGFTGTYHNFSPQVSRNMRIEGSEETNALKPVSNYRGLEVATYLEDDFTIGDWLRVDAGVRYTLMTVGRRKYSSLQPRLSLDANIVRGLSVSASYARMTQYVHLLSSTQLALPSDLWVPITDRIPPVLTDHYCFGVNWNWNGWELGVDSYYKHSDNVIDYKSGSSLYGTESWDNLVAVGESRSKGLEFSLKRNVGKAKGWLAYTLSKTERRYADGSINNGAWYPYQYDRTHNIVINGTYTFNDRIDVGATWTYASGNKMTLPSRMGIIPNKALPGYVHQGVVYLSKNNYTLPPSHRLNVSANFHKKLRRGERTWTVGIYNVYNAMNPNIVLERPILDNEGRVVGRGIRTVTYLPFLPSFMYTYSF